jgi:hypothetical protein
MDTYDFRAGAEARSRREWMKPVGDMSDEYRQYLEALPTDQKWIALREYARGAGDTSLAAWFLNKLLPRLQAGEIVYDRTWHPMPLKMERALRKAHDFVVQIIEEVNENAVGHHDHAPAASSNRVKGAMEHYKREAAQFKDAPSYDEMVVYVIYGTTDAESVGDGD